MQHFAFILVCPNSKGLAKTATVKPVLSDPIQQDIFLVFQTGGCFLLHESSAEHELSALLSCSDKPPPVNSDFQVT